MGNVNSERGRQEAGTQRREENYTRSPNNAAIGNRRSAIRKIENRRDSPIALLNATAIQVHNTSELPKALHEIGLQEKRPTLVLVGGASGLSDRYIACLRKLFVEKLAPLIEKAEAYVVDGGTDAGVMQLMGQTRLNLGGTFPLIGVAAIGTVIIPNIKNTFVDAAPLEQNHTHFVLVPGNNWGDESPWIADVATTLANGAPSVTILINGGKIALQDAKHSIRVNRPLVVVAGSGRTADRIVTAMRGKASDQQATDDEKAADEQAKQVAEFEKLTAIDLDDDFNLLIKAIAQIWGTGDW